MVGYNLKWLDRVDTEEGSKKFEEDYEMSVWEYIVRYRLFNITHINTSDYKYIAFLEGADGSINCLLSLENEDKGEYLEIFNGVSEEYIFNTDGMAVIRVIRENKQVAMFTVNNSPYDIQNTKEDNEFLENNYEVTRQEVIDNINEMIKDSELEKATIENTLLVGQL